VAARLGRASVPCRSNRASTALESRVGVYDLRGRNDVGFYVILRPDGRIDDVRVTELLIMLGSLFLALIASIAPAIVILRWLAPTSMPDEEQKRNLEIAREHIREYTEKWQERSAQRMVLWHVPSLIIGAIVIAALCVMVLARAFMR
jgi:hypothetical protein